MQQLLEPNSIWQHCVGKSGLQAPIRSIKMLLNNPGSGSKDSTKYGV